MRSTTEARLDLLPPLHSETDRVLPFPFPCPFPHVRLFAVLLLVLPIEVLRIGLFLSLFNSHAASVGGV